MILSVRLHLIDRELIMKEKYTFTAVIENPGGGGAFVRIPFDVEKVFGKKRVPVEVLIDGEAYRGTLVRMGEPCHILIVVKEIRRKIGKEFGDKVEVVLEEDLQPRVVEIPADFQAALEQQPAARDAFNKLAYTHQREHVRAILDAKREETRANRIQKAIELLKQAKKGS
jgi:hypothetical protein